MKVLLSTRLRLEYRAEQCSMPHCEGVVKGEEKNFASHLLHSSDCQNAEPVELCVLKNVYLVFGA